MQANGEYIVPVATQMNSIPSTACSLQFSGNHGTRFRNWGFDFANYQLPQVETITIAKNCYDCVGKIAFTSMLMQTILFQ